MAFLWIFALAIVAVAAAKEAPGAVPGCGEPEPTTPKPRKHGIVTNVNSCNSTVLMWNGRELPAKCMVRCPKNTSYPVTDLMPCLRFTNESFLQERKDGSKPPYTCKVGVCLNGKCQLKKRPEHKVPCTVPADRTEQSE
uniref:Evasin n=1 Tax=Amblyomma cajennense TaxID=34607 RepID=A0A023FRP3_AMBCJ